MNINLNRNISITKTLSNLILGLLILYILAIILSFFNEPFDDAPILFITMVALGVLIPIFFGINCYIIKGLKEGINTMISLGFVFTIINGILLGIVACIHSNDGTCAIAGFVAFVYTGILQIVLIIITSLILKYKSKRQNKIVDSVSKIFFYPNNREPFSTTENSIIKIAEQVKKQFGKTEFQPNELQEFYNEFIKSYQPTLQGEQLVLAVKKLKEFVEAGGRFEIS